MGNMFKINKIESSIVRLPNRCFRPRCLRREVQDPAGPAGFPINADKRLGGSCSLSGLKSAEARNH